MELISQHGIQLGFALLGSLALFVAAYALPERWIVALLVLCIPFQFITSRYGTVNVGMVYLAFVAFVMQGRIQRLPYLPLVAVIVFAYLLSMALSLPSSYRAQGFYLFNVLASFPLFYLIYNHFYRQPSAHFAIWLLVWLNVVVLFSSLLQLAVGFDRYVLFGISEWTIGGNREDNRLIGPFGTAGVNGTFYILQILMLLYAFLRLEGALVRIFLALNAIGNFAMLVGTGSRGAFLALIFGTAVFLFMFRQRLGTLRMLTVISVGAAFMALAALLMIMFTPFGTLFERLAGTEFEGVVPDTRRGAWALAFERIPDAIMFGHGPRIKFDDMPAEFIREVFIGYPHNLYLFLLYSIGVVGLGAWIAWFATLALHWLAVARRQTGVGLEAELPRLGVVLLVTFLFDQLKVEFLRFQFVDYQQYAFTSWAVFAAFAVLAAERMRQPAGQPMPATRTAAVPPPNNLTPGPIIAGRHTTPGAGS